MLEYHLSISRVASVVCRAAASGIPDDREIAGGRLKMMINHPEKPSVGFTYLHPGRYLTASHSSAHPLRVRCDQYQVKTVW